VTVWGVTLFETRLEGFLEVSAVACGLMILLALFCAFARLAQGPTLADRVVALDFVSMLLVAFLTLFALAARRDAFLDAALALALVAFLATVAFARYLLTVRAREGRRE
jgi:multicomponent Na+:H+ antiporter subunit F